MQLLSHFNVPALVCINKYDLNQNNTKTIVSFCSKKNVDVIGIIPFEPTVTKAMVAETPVVEFAPNNVVSNSIKQIWKRVSKKMKSIS